LNGTGAQNISGGSAFNNLTINKSTGSATISTNATVNGILNFVAGNIQTGSNFLIQPSGGTVTGASQSTGWVNGKLKKNIATGATTKTFEVGDSANYTPVLVAFSSVTAAGNLTAFTTGNDHPNISSSTINPTKSVNRFWTLTNSGIAFTHYSTTLNFKTTDVDAGANTSSFDVELYNGSSWQLPVTASPATTSIRADSVTAFGDFAIGEICNKGTTISYTSSPYCSNAGTASVTLTGTGGGIFSSTSGLSINTGTGAVNPASSMPGTYVVTYTVTAGGGCSTYNTTANIIVSLAPSASIAYTGSPYCSNGGTATVMFSSGTTGGIYSAGAGLVIDSTTGNITLGSSIAGTYTVTYTVAAANGCSVFSTTTRVTIAVSGTWTGAVNNDWNTPGNWFCGAVPGSTINVTIPTGLSDYPIISSGISTVNNITIQNGASLTVTGATLQIAGTISNSGTFTTSNGTIEMNGSFAQTIPAGIFSGNLIKDLTINNNAGVTLAGTLNMSNELTVSNGSLTTGGYLKLLSTDTTTARVTQITSGAGTPISGIVTVERYIKGRRKYRLITSSVTTSTSTILTSGQEGFSIWGNWQNQGNTSTAFNGTFITGGSSANGFDQQTPNASMFTYNGTTRLFEGFTTANGKNTKYTPLKAGVPYYMFVYGDRTNTAITGSPYQTVLSATGTLLTGDQTYTTSSSIPLSNTVGGYTMIGNPYASPIDWSTITRTNLSDTYWGWDPNLSSTGGYVTVSTTGTVTLISPFSGSVGLDQYIQSGQGFFVKTTASSPVLIIKESDKVSNFNPNAFRGQTNRGQANGIPLIAVNLFYDDATGPLLMDGTLAAFDPSFSNQLGKEDASKIYKSGEGIGIKLQSELLSIDARNMPLNNDTLFLNTSGLNKPQYRLQIFAKQMDSSRLEPWLEDTYLNTSHLLSLTDTNYITFTLDAAVPATGKTDRFRILFRKSGDLSTLITSISAVKENRTVRVNWNVSSETGILKYEVQRSDAGTGFLAKGDVLATGLSNYQWIDHVPFTGANNYRIKVIQTDGSSFFSKFVTVIMDEEKPEMKIFPNPVENYMMNARFTNLEKGKYTARLINAKGQTVMESIIDYDGASASKSFQINHQVAAGIYYFLLINEKIKLSQPVFIK
jgi:hypothetical protein